MEKDKYIMYKDVEYMILKAINYQGNDYIFVVNNSNLDSVKLLICLNELEEITDVDLIRNVLLKMN